MRIISGTHKGRRLSPPKRLPVRPTTDRAKEALFNILNNLFKWKETTVLDLFTGTGSISFEFASRGAKSITSVDQNKDCIKYINEISKDFSFKISTVKKNVFDFLESNPYSFDIIFLDPPYIFQIKDYENVIMKLFFYKWLEKGLIIVEHSVKVNLDEVFGFLETRTYGNNSFSFFKNKAGR